MNTSRSHSLGQLCCRISRTLKSLLPALFTFTFVVSSHAAAWGVSGHGASPDWPVYDYQNSGGISIPAQLDRVKAVGATYYRVDAPEVWDIKDLYSATLFGSYGNAYSSIKILPVIYIPSWVNMNGNIDTIYNQCRDHAYWWTSFWLDIGYPMFEAIEVENEIDNRCILPGRSGSFPADYDNAKFAAYRNAIIGLCDGVRARHTTVKRLVGTAGWYHYGFLDRIISDVGVKWEGVAWHWYSDMGSITAPNRAEIKKRLGEYYAWYGMKTWLTELNRRDGTWGTSEQGHANVLAEQQNAWKIQSFVHMISAYELFNESNMPNNPEGHYGFYHTSRVGANWVVGPVKTAVFNAFWWNR